MSIYNVILVSFLKPDLICFIKSTLDARKKLFVAIRKLIVGNKLALGHLAKVLINRTLEAGGAIKSFLEKDLRHKKHLN